MRSDKRLAELKEKVEALNKELDELMKEERERDNGGAPHGPGEAAAHSPFTDTGMEGFCPRL